MKTFFLHAAIKIAKRPYFKGRDRLTNILLSLASKYGWHRVELEGLLFDLNLRDALSQSIFLNQQLPADTWKLLIKLLNPGMTFVDIGANIGYTTLCGARVVGQSGSVFAFEPSPRAFNSLKRNVEINNYNWVKVEQAACGEKREVTNFYVSTYSDEYNSLGEDQNLLNEKIECQVVRLDEYLSAQGKKPDVIKIDVEGAEWQVLTGMTDLFSAENPPLLIIEASFLNAQRFDYKPSEMFEWLKKYNYDFVIWHGKLLDYTDDFVNKDGGLCDVVCFNSSWESSIKKLKI